ncbi:MAG: hypothetical protein HUU21_39710 [Polyangiaceae bacterium]|nr:hypothetical protein [Polyangiaceae bacterium]
MKIQTSALYWAMIAVGSFVVLGCGPGDPESEVPEDADRCVADEGGGEAMESREVALGVWEAGSFRAFQNGEEAELIAGFQGGYMITPAVRVEAAGDSSAEACFRVRLENALMEGGEVGPGTLSQVVFARSGDFYYVESLYNLLGYDSGPLQGKTLLLSATVSGVGFEGTQALTLRLK